MGGNTDPRQRNHTLQSLEQVTNSGPHACPHPRCVYLECNAYDWGQRKEEMRGLGDAQTTGEGEQITEAPAMRTLGPTLGQIAAEQFQEMIKPSALFRC